MYSFICRINNACFRRHPLITNVAISCGIAGTADYIAQKFVQGYQTLDTQRTRHMVTYSCTTAPLWHLWYNMIDRHIKPSKAWLKMVLDQTTITPLDYIGFFAVFNYVRGDSIEECISELNRLYFKALIPDAVFWPSVTLIGYKWIPLRYRFLYFEFLGLVWDTFLSYLKYSGKDEGDHIEIRAEHTKLDNDVNNFQISYMTQSSGEWMRMNSMIYNDFNELNLSNFGSDLA